MSEIEKLAALAVKADDLITMHQSIEELRNTIQQLQEPRALKTEEVAKILRVSPPTVVSWANQGLIPAIRSRNGYRYPSHRIFAIAEQRAAELAEQHVTRPL